MIVITNVTAVGLMDGVKGNPQNVTIECVKVGDKFEVIGPVRVLTLKGEGEICFGPNGENVHPVWDPGVLFYLDSEMDAVTVTTTHRNLGIPSEPYGLLIMILRPA